MSNEIKPTVKEGYIAKYIAKVHTISRKNREVDRLKASIHLDKVWLAAISELLEKKYGITPKELDELVEKALGQ